MQRKREGFNNQLTIVLPNNIQNELRNDALTKLLFVSDIGYYPAAKYHYRERQEGCPQSILIFCIHGTGWVETNGVQKKVTKGTFFIIPADMPHKYWTDDTDPWSIYWLHFTGMQASVFNNQAITLNNIHIGDNTRNDRRIRLFEEIYQTLSMGYSKENLEYSATCLWYLLGSFYFPPQFERIRNVQQADIIEKSILYMNDHLYETINLKELASHCGYSVSHFSSVFRKKTSRSPIEYYLDLKMQMACQLLDFTDKRIKEIANELSFDDPFYFSRLFKQFIGISPVEYRKKMKG